MIHLEVLVQLKSVEDFSPTLEYVEPFFFVSTCAASVYKIIFKLFSEVFNSTSIL